MKEGFDGFDSRYLKEGPDDAWRIVSEVIPYIGLLYACKREGNQVTITDLDGKVVLSTSSNHFDKFMEEERESRNFRAIRAERESGEEGDDVDEAGEGSEPNAGESIKKKAEG